MKYLLLKRKNDCLLVQSDLVERVLFNGDGVAIYIKGYKESACVDSAADIVSFDTLVEAVSAAGMQHQVVNYPAPLKEAAEAERVTAAAVAAGNAASLFNQGKLSKMWKPTHPHTLPPMQMPTPAYPMHGDFSDGDMDVYDLRERTLSEIVKSGYKQV
jgi:hypothetical protein